MKKCRLLWPALSVWVPRSFPANSYLTKEFVGTTGRFLNSQHARIFPFQDIDVVLAGAEKSFFNFSDNGSSFGHAERFRQPLPLQQKSKKSGTPENSYQASGICFRQQTKEFLASVIKFFYFLPNVHTQMMNKHCANLKSMLTFLSLSVDGWVCLVWMSKHYSD